MKANSHSAGQSVAHVTWSTKYRYDMFRKRRLNNLADAAVRQAAARHGLELHELAVARDHVHAVVRFPVDMSVSRVVQLLKGVSSRLIFQEEEKLRLRYPQGHLWSVGYSYRTVGDADRGTVENYVAEHRRRQATLPHFNS